MEMTGAEAILASLKEEQVPEALSWACMMPFTAQGSPISSLAMNKGRSMQRMGMPGLREKWGSASLPAVPESAIWSPGSPPPIWIPSLW